MGKNTFNHCFDFDALILSWERVNASVGSDAKDFFGINIFKSDLTSNISKLQEKLISKNYVPQRPFKYFEPKKNGMQRTKTVLSIEDALVFQAISNYVAEKNYSNLSETHHSVFGSILNKDVPKGVNLLQDEPDNFYFFESYINPYNKFIDSINETLKSGNVTHILETDITGFFDTIPHSTLIIELKNRNIDGEILELLAKCLNVWSGTRDSATIGVGIPQGPAGSFLFANIILDSMDRIAIKSGLHYYRFMDDIRIYGKSSFELKSCLVTLDCHLKGKSLSLNSQKTSIETIENHKTDKEKFLDEYGIRIDKEKSVGLSDDILEQDSTQVISGDQNEQVISSEKIYPIYEAILDQIEKDLIAQFEPYYVFEEDIEDFDLRNFLTLSQKWRTIVKLLKQFEGFTPNMEMFNVWTFGIETFFWKANNFVWNIQLYDDITSKYKYLIKLIDQFQSYEWVQYQILSSMKNAIGSLDNYQEILQRIPKTDSPFVRLGYFNVLLETINSDTKFFQSVAELIKEEQNSYVKNSILYLINQKHLNISIDTLKSWFL